MITVQECSKYYGHRPVLNKISFSVQPGSRTAVLGGNGAGKTTLLFILAALIRPSGGTVRVGGYSVTQYPHIVRKMTGLVAHQPGLYSDLTAYENLMLFSRMYGIQKPAGRVRDLLEQVGLARQNGLFVRHFSRGMLQRLSIAKAILHRPDILLLDEPLTGLDAGAQHALIDILESRNRNTTIFFTTHRFDFAKQHADRILVLKNLGIRADCSVKDITTLELDDWPVTGL
ncbi:MAG: ABC transporter ATP-binding protein [candidate division KSB1 bacterium]|nr:ABC transporter ATP-binding protein [candidate division KSB1 bacterium]